MRNHPETIRAFLLRTTALYSGVVKAPTPPDPYEIENANGVVSIYYKSKRTKKMKLHPY